MKTLPLFLSAGLLCAGLAVGCSESGSGEATPPAEGTSASADGNPAWVADANITRAHLEVTGMD
ncbi:MAG: hypothetical protein AAGA29_00815 [Planctomycetota bacterium]